VKIVVQSNRKPPRLSATSLHEFKMQTETLGEFRYLKINVDALLAK